MRETIIAKNTDPRDEFCLGIVIEHECKNFDCVGAMRAAAAEFINSGMDTTINPDAAYNWGDFVESMPEYFCQKHGCKIIDTFTTDLIVEHNERLNPEV